MSSNPKKPAPANPKNKANSSAPKKAAPTKPNSKPPPSSGKQPAKKADGSQKPSSSHSSSSSDHKSSKNPHQQQKSNPKKPHNAKKSGYRQQKFSEYDEDENPLTTGNYVEAYEVYDGDVSLQLAAHQTRQQALGKAPRRKPKQVFAAQNRRNTVYLPGIHQDRIIDILKESTISLDPDQYYGSHDDSHLSFDENVNLLTKIGFRKYEVLQALQYSKNNYHIALEWLIIHVDNGDLPLGFKSSYASTKIEVQSGSSDSLKHKQLVRRLEAYGFLKTQINRQLELNDNDEMQSLYYLLESHLTRDAVSIKRKMSQKPNCDDFDQFMEDIKQHREDERVTLESILGDEGEYKQVSDNLIKISLKVAWKKSKLAESNEEHVLNVEFHFPENNYYPEELPLIGMTCSTLKAEVIYAFTKRIVVEAANYVGQVLIYPVITWIIAQAPKALPNLIKLFEDPQKCKEAHQTYSKTIREDEFEREALKSIKKEIKSNAANQSTRSNHHNQNLDDSQNDEDLIVANQIDDPKLTEFSRKLHEDLTIFAVESYSPAPKSASEIKAIQTRSSELKLKLDENRKSNPDYAKMIKQRSTLPAFQAKFQILDLLNQSQVILISGATGCGKTTQVAQLIFDDMIDRGIGGECNIVCTQPRRISAIGVAERVAAERCEAIGQSVGYTIKLESKRTNETQIMFVTTGILLRRLQEDPWLDQVSHLIIDEVHERDLNSDFLLIILKELVTKRSNLKLILMSATLNAESFSNYFDRCPTLEIPGRTFPVQQFFLEDSIEATGYHLDIKSPYAQPGRKYQLYEGYSVQTSNVLALYNRQKINYELITRLVEHIFEKYPKSNGAILIFMPGMQEITTMVEWLQTHPLGRKMTILPLHSSLSSEQQQRIFRKPLEGTRKVVISTNIAETSVTVDDVVYVIDTCRFKETRYDGAVESLVEDFTSKASIRQRMGRAGRVQAGFCWTLVTKSKATHLKEFQDPEILRVPLESMILQIKCLRLGKPRSFLSKALDPPPMESIDISIKNLQSLDALDLKEDLTPLGYHLGKLPVSPRLAKILIYGALFKCLDPILTICAALSDKAPFVSTFENREDAEDSKRSWDMNDEYHSDHLTIVKAYEEWEKISHTGSSNENQWCKQNFLSKMTLHNLRDLRKQFRQILKDCGFTHTKKSAEQKSLDIDNDNSGDVLVIKAVLCAGFYPNIAHLKPFYDTAGNITSTKLWTRDGEEVFIHPSSVLSYLKKFPANFIVFHDRVLTTKLFLRDCTAVGTYPAILFGGSLEVYPEEQMLEIDGWLQFYTSGREAILFLKIRQELDKLLLSKAANPKLDISKNKVTEVIIGLLKGEPEII